ncbi:tyrosine-protein kinase Dnt-like [Trichogramma pretiosum]|uniref:tyrosine-protein kinase Dnt-like n=1 Tax=Trichogramma pretiosum TaxID=7493 RepID=UPI0006C9AEF0|nr:tyrosine-protein kinase Dnt-like [Trichogramma pretiosum]
MTAIKMLLLLLAACGYMANPAAGFFNLFLSQTEVHKLMGLNAELFYVREGVINEYAIKFVVPVPAKLDKLHFTWENLAGRPLPYTVFVDISNPTALSSSLNISDAGEIPVGGLQTWAVALHCGPYDAEIDVTLRINVSLTRRNTTSLEFKRKKICLKGQSLYHDPEEMYSPSVASSASSSSSSSVERSGISPGGQVFYAAVGCACAFIAAICVLVTAYYVRDKKARRHREPLQESRGLGSACSVERGTGIGPAQTFLLPDTPPPASSAASVTTYRRIDERSNRELYERIQEITVQRCRVRLLSIEMEGTFGRVYRASYHEEGAPTPRDVLVKTTSEQASQAQMAMLLREGLALYGLNHPTLLPVLGVSIEERGSPFVLYPHTNYRNMKHFLLRCKHGNGDGAPTRALTTQELVEMALQVAKGVQYLHRKRLVHRDIAARNLVVDDELRVQITDNALARDLFPQDYICLGDTENRPIKWLAIESLLNKTFSTATDVWAFGVLLWEFTTLAQQPYVEVDPFEMISYLSNGYRLAQPVNCPDELFAMMAYCWAMSPDERPTFSQLIVCLQEFHVQLTKYV